MQSVINISFFFCVYHSLLNTYIFICLTVSKNKKINKWMNKRKKRTAYRVRIYSPWPMPVTRSARSRSLLFSSFFFFLPLFLSLKVSAFRTPFLLISLLKIYIYKKYKVGNTKKCVQTRSFKDDSSRIICTYKRAVSQFSEKIEILFFTHRFYNI